MALSKTRLVTTLVTNFLNLPMRNPAIADADDPNYWTTIGALMPETPTAVEDFFTFFVDAIIDEIVDHAEVTVTMSNHTHTGVTTGTGVSGTPSVIGNTEAGVIE